VLALGVLDALTARGLTPGRDVSVIGFDDLPEAAQAGSSERAGHAARRTAAAAQPPDPEGHRRRPLRVAELVEPRVGAAVQH
jgi:ABC-type sugar transport system substrate-binding protein